MAEQTAKLLPFEHYPKIALNLPPPAKVYGLCFEESRDVLYFIQEANDEKAA